MKDVGLFSFLFSFVFVNLEQVLVLVSEVLFGVIFRGRYLLPLVFPPKKECFGGQ